MSSAAFTSIATERLLLRRFRGGDLEPFVAMRADPAVARYQGWSDFDRAAGEAFIAGMSAAEPDTPGAWFQFAIEHEGGSSVTAPCTCPRTDRTRSSSASP